MKFKLELEVNLDVLENDDDYRLNYCKELLEHLLDNANTDIKIIDLEIKSEPKQSENFYWTGQCPYGDR